MTGRIWLAGVAEPLVLDLAGDCAPDLAGCAITFENPAPLAKVFEILDSGGQPPAHLANALVIEWFNPRYGVFRFETTNFRLTVSAPVWRFTTAEIAERERGFEAETTDFLDALRADDEGGEWDEFRNEQLLRESDTMNVRGAAGATSSTAMRTSASASSRTSWAGRRTRNISRRK